MPIVEEIRTVTANGRVVVPWVIQRALGLEHGGPVRFVVEDGVVTVFAVDARTSETAASVDDCGARRSDIRATLAAELKSVLDAAERDRAIEAANG
jgi:bifunctional DNA-binding transcriptional regulator/antitoxin component of YhaV-PrlF toxin-antitoxin module